MSTDIYGMKVPKLVNIITERDGVVITNNMDRSDLVLQVSTGQWGTVLLDYSESTVVDGLTEVSTRWVEKLPVLQKVKTNG